MKRVLTWLGTVGLILVLSFTVGASSFEADGSYVFGTGKEGVSKTESRGFVVHASAEIMSDFLADGSFLSTNATKIEGAELPEGSSLREQLLAAGGLYRVVSEEDLQVFVGAGLVDFKTKKDGVDLLKGKGIYGKFGFRFNILPEINLIADLSFAPKFKNDDEKGDLLSARATVGYQIIKDIGLQGTVKYYKASLGTTSSTNTLIGGGLVISF